MSSGVTDPEDRETTMESDGLTGETVDRGPSSAAGYEADTTEGGFAAAVLGNADEVLYRVMHLESVLYDLTDPSPLVHLLEADMPFRFLVVPMALPDAIALQNAHGDIEGRRPSTHELMTTILTRLQAEVIAARIVRYESGVFYAELDLMTPRGREVIDCRTSDALTLALRQSAKAPILCAEEVLQAYYA